MSLFHTWESEEQLFLTWGLRTRPPPQALDPRTDYRGFANFGEEKIRTLFSLTCY